MRFHWKTRRDELQSQWLSGRYVVSPAHSFNVNGHCISVCEAEDALVSRLLTVAMSKEFGPK
ncbi:hypothetical protein, partial [Vibrio sonorensis]|uniref:hypothetical protein n=1 Tax=Vibrio sonorensis TaxID=1004316 RepID=UPI001C2F7F12